LEISSGVGLKLNCNWGQNPIAKYNRFNRKLTSWLIEYNFNRPHQNLDYLAPMEYIEKELVKKARSPRKVLPMYSARTPRKVLSGLRTARLLKAVAETRISLAV